MEDAKNFAERIAEKRENIELLSGYLQRDKDKIKHPKCPRCGGAPDPDYANDLKRDTLHCERCSHSWNAIKGDPKARETTLAGGAQ